jgi:prepilin-type N-terminal cleavage/methylation domain-containing protein
MKFSPLQRGFSLIELICVMAIIGLLTAFAMPVYQTLSHAASASWPKWH